MRLILLSFLLGATRAFIVAPPSTLQQHATASRRGAVSRPGGRGDPSPLFDLNKRLAEQMGVPEVFSDNEWHPRDPATSVPQLMSSIWGQITHAGNMAKGETYTVVYPDMEQEFSPSFINRLMGHLDNCKDVCDHFGIKTILVPYLEKTKVVGFTAKSYSDPGEDDEMEFEYDPFWDDEEIGDYDGIDAEEDGDDFKDKYPEIVNKIPDDDDQIIGLTKTWVSKMMSDMGVCPFTSGSELAGLPMGQVYYAVDRCSGIEEMYLSYWKEVVRVEISTEKDLSTTLLVCPEFCMDNIEMFESFTNTLTQPLVALGVEDLLQLVFFHPLWTFRDGGDRTGEGMAANYARRSPWPMINILRTSQVRAAQKGIPTGLVYTQNEKTLKHIGVDKLETMLRMRDWDQISDVKVDRRDMEALRVAQDYQQTGVVQSQDLSFEGDATPAANKVDAQQIEQGNLINVIMQALEKRLGLSDSGSVTRLSGPETSATIMASDFLLAELNVIIEQQRSKPQSAAHQYLLDDVMGNESTTQQRDDDEMDVLFGGGGIKMGNDGDE
eukprot:CAMPEP_0119016238 /NCGR_PEP_ID=MMETSP1176-20130426/11890_1 /TAXON_ID=265551 /ORGANISM="Synedropsis recta cf, Strain CCMP1620" /LENGTH=550 /DNA_ID=CAMNT_0006969579 /DNA_START=116 /DNA_END=1765 /DNA_ORIENTATION=+